MAKVPSVVDILAGPGADSAAPPPDVDVGPPVLVTVAPGRSIQGLDGRIYLPGEEAPIPPGDVDHITQHGFVADPAPPPVVRTAPALNIDNPANVGIQRTET